MDDIRVTILRSRFQPFTRLHLDSINWYFENQKSCDFPPTLVLCVIRDYDTVHYRYRLNPEIQTDDLRHLAIFNPLSAWDILYILHRNIPEQYLKNILTITVPLKFNEFFSAINNSGDIIPKSIHKYFRFLEQKAKCTTKDTCESLLTNKNNVGKWWSYQSYDISPIPEVDGIFWFFPIFDNEDYSDWLKVKGNDKWSNKTIILPMMNKFSYTPITFDEAPELGIYGIFIYYNYLFFRDSNNECEDIEKVFANIVLDINYKRVVTTWKSNSIHILNNQEKDLLKDDSRFVSLCRDTIATVSSPPHTKDIRAFYVTHYENQILSQMEKKIATAQEWQKTSVEDFSRNDAAFKYFNILNRISNMMSQGIITWQELTQKFDIIEKLLNLDTPDEVISNLPLIQNITNKL